MSSPYVSQSAKYLGQTIRSSAARVSEAEQEGARRPNGLRFSCHQRRAAEEGCKNTMSSRAEGGQLHARVQAQLRSFFASMRHSLFTV
jgi:hypothetical protein